MAFLRNSGHPGAGMSHGTKPVQTLDEYHRSRVIYHQKPRWAFLVIFTAKRFRFKLFLWFKMKPAYGQEQLDQFFDHVGFPQHLRCQPPSLALLEALHIHTLSTLPYENLSIHYNPSHWIDLEPQHLFQKMIVHGRGRGGFCMEIAILYNHILRAIGFDAFTAGVRTRGRLQGVPRGDYPGW